jgi:predicted ester cyclase
MTHDALEAFVRRHIETFNGHEPAALAAQHALDGVVESPMFANLRGRVAIEESYRSFLTAFPDAVFTLDTVVVDTPRVAVFLKMKATHAGELFGLPGTQKRVQVPMARLMTVDESLIAHERRIYDFTGLLVQLGVLLAKPARPV